MCMLVSSTASVTRRNGTVEVRLAIRHWQPRERVEAEVTHCFLLKPHPFASLYADRRQV